MKVLSLFDGISCGRLALERAGLSVEKYDAFETDKYAVSVSANNFPDIIQHGERIYSVHGKSVTLSANGGGQGAKTGLYKIDLPDGDYIIRKLTPVEAERLQTLPDNYTAGISNTQLYKCIGNGWTVDVIAHILGGLKNVE